MQCSNICGTMGRREELSDFQRGTVVGCHLCKKSVREISALLNLPRSTVSAVILKWKRGGITTALPRSGRPHKLKEEDRQVLEKVALENCLPSVEALTAEFQTASGANVSSRTVRRELLEMGFRGRVSTYNKPVGECPQTFGNMTLICEYRTSVYTPAALHGEVSTGFYETCCRDLLY